MIRRSSPSSAHLAAGPLAEEDPVAGLDGHRDQLARFLAGALPDGDDLALGGLFLGGVGDDQTALGLLFALDPADEDAVVKGRELHGVLPLRFW